MESLRLNSRQAAVLLILLSDNPPRSAKELGAQVGISPRMIRYNLPRIQSWLNSRGAKLISKPGSGITLDIGDSLRKQLQHELHQEEFFALLTAEDRQTLLMFELLVHGDYRKRENLASCLSTSTATLSRDLQDMEACLRESALTLKRKPHMGVKVIGQESAIRNRLLSLILETGLESALLNICLWGDTRSHLNGTSRFPVQEQILKEMLGWDLPGAWRWISRLRQKLNTNFSEVAQLHLALLWAIMVRR
jgi:activator of the mannose operon (transcriptional antiterminator)